MPWVIHLKFAMFWALILHGCQCGDGAGRRIDEQLTVRRLQVVAGKWMLTMMLGMLGAEVIFYHGRWTRPLQHTCAVSANKEGC